MCIADCVVVITCMSFLSWLWLRFGVHPAIPSLPRYLQTTPTEYKGYGAVRVVVMVVVVVV